MICTSSVLCPLHLLIMEKSLHIISFITLVSLVSAASVWRPQDDSNGGQRLVIVDRQPSSKKTGFIINDGIMAISESTDKGNTWTRWTPINVTSYPKLVSNPVFGVDEKSKLLNVFVQAIDGQVYAFTEGKAGNDNFTVTKLTTNIPSSLPVSKFSLDAIKLLSVPNVTHMFVRSQSNRSRIYHSYQEWKSGTWSAFKPIGDDDNHLVYDFDVVINTFLKRIEVFAVVGDLKVKHTWQNGYLTFDDGWHELVLLGSPKFNSAPVAHAIGKTDFNGMIEVFARVDNQLYHIHQTTCDKVNNPWGPCTWELSWHQTGGNLPSDANLPNPFTISNNIHQGQEIFVIGASDGALYHIWQPEQGDSWSDWNRLGTFSDGTKFTSLPCIVIDEVGWWEAYGNSASGIHKYIQTDLSFTATPAQQPYGLNVTVNWRVPTDQATSKDWIGVYPKNADNSKYVNFRYVGGGQNPEHTPVQKGSLQFINILPDGVYEYRYLVNKQFINVTNAAVQTINAPDQPEWVFLYQGIAMGLGVLSTNITACVKDGNATIGKFEDSFSAFEDREIFKGLNLFGEALQDVVDTLVQCEETDVAEDVVKFVEALIACTSESNCEKFAIDVAIEIVIIYERFYEIYGDILAANNCFKIKAYEMGGLCIGRVTNACLSAPDISRKQLLL